MDRFQEFFRLVMLHHQVKVSPLMTSLVKQTPPETSSSTWWLEWLKMSTYVELLIFHHSLDCTHFLLCWSYSSLLDLPITWLILKLYNLQTMHTVVRHMRTWAWVSFLYPFVCLKGGWMGSSLHHNLLCYKFYLCLRNRYGLFLN